MCLFISLMIYQLNDALDWVAEGKGSIKVPTQKSQRRRQRAFLVGFLLLSFVKMVMNPYPTLHDLSIVIFFLLMNITLISTYVEAFTFIVFGILYAVINTGLMLVTWLHRFSGNSNFLFFQDIVLDSFLVILFI